MRIKQLNATRSALQGISDWEIGQNTNFGGLNDELISKLVDAIDAFAMAGPEGLVSQQMAWSAEEYEDFIAEGRAPIGELPKTIKGRMNLYVRIGRYLTTRIAAEPDNFDLQDIAVTFLYSSIDDLFGKLMYRLKIKSQMLKGKPGSYAVKKTWQKQIRKFCDQVNPDNTELYMRIMSLTLQGWNDMSYDAMMSMQTTSEEREVLNMMVKASNTKKFTIAKLEIVQMIVTYLKKVGMHPHDVLAWMGIPSIDWVEGLALAAGSSDYKQKLTDALLADFGELPEGRVDQGSLFGQIAKMLGSGVRQLSMEEADERKAQIVEQVNSLIPQTANAGNLEVSMTPLRIGASNRAIIITYLNPEGEMVTVKIVPPFSSYDELLAAIAHEDGHGWQARHLGALWEKHPDDDKEEVAICVENSVVATLSQTGQSVSKFRAASGMYRQFIFGLIQAKVWTMFAQGATIEEVYEATTKLVAEKYNIELDGFSVDMSSWQSVWSNVSHDPTDGIVYVVSEVLAMMPEPEDDEEDAVAEESDADEEMEEPNAPKTLTLTEVMANNFGASWITNPQAVAIFEEALKAGESPVSAVVLRLIEAS